MVDEKQSADNQKVVEDVDTNVDEKQSNKTFTQSEFDARVADIEKKYKSELSGVADIKQKLEELEKEKKERELAEMSEIEKRDAMIADLTKQNDDFKSKTLELSQKVNRIF